MAKAKATRRVGSMDARFAEAVCWIADNDMSCEDDDRDELSTTITVALVADVWGCTREQVAEEVLRIRKQG